MSHQAAVRELKSRVSSLDLAAFLQDAADTTAVDG
jgi:hypothetical protein